MCRRVDLDQHLDMLHFYSGGASMAIFRYRIDLHSPVA